MWVCLCLCICILIFEYIIIHLHALCILESLLIHECLCCVSIPLFVLRRDGARLLGLFLALWDLCHGSAIISIHFNMWYYWHCEESSGYEVTHAHHYNSS